MKVSVVIPNYNGVNYIKECICSLKRQTFQDFEIIIVDNGSLDGSRNLIKKEYPNIKSIFLDKNYGFSKAVNIGIKESSAEFVVLLNNDTKVEPLWLESLVKCISKDPNIFSCSSKMIRYHERNLIDDAGDQYSIFGKAYKRGDGQDIRLYNEDTQVFSSCAGAAIYRRELFNEIGYFDENFFAYMEDVDIGYRARIYGYKNMYCSSAIVYHIGSATTGSVRHNSFKVKLAARNNIYVHYKNMPIIQRLINSPFIFLGLFIKLMFFNINGFGKDFIDGTKEGFSTRKELKKVPFKIKHIKNYLYIEWLMIKNTFKIK